MVIWVTGLSGAGKTTLCTSILKMLRGQAPEVVLLDGDLVREAFGHDLTHTEKDRVRQVKRLQQISKLLADQGMIVVVAVLYSHPELLQWNRENLRDYFEIFLNVSLQTVFDRDVKGLYALAKAGNMPNVVGLDIPWYAPESPDLVLKPDDGSSPAELCQHFLEALPMPLRDRVSGH